MDDKLSYAVIGKAMQVHRELGPGLDETFYQELLSARLRSAGIAHQSKPRENLVHRGRTADTFEADLVVGAQLVPELKVLRGKFTDDHLAQLICYLKFWRIPTGLLLDFGKESLCQRRVVFTEPPPPGFDAAQVAAAAPAFVTDHRLLASVLQSVETVARTYGLGYRDTTYRGLVAADLAAEGIGCFLQPVAPIRCGGQSLGEARCDCLAIEQGAAALVLALRDAISAADRAILQTYLKHLGLPWGLAVNFGKRHLETRFVVAPKCAAAPAESEQPPV